MKKTLFLLLAFAASMSINAQVMKLLKGNEVVAIYSVDQVDKVVFQKDQTPTRGTATRNDNVQVKWVQLWAGGPKFAEYNVGAADNKAEDYGGYYCWGGSHKNGEGIDWMDDHNTGSEVLSGVNDTATNLWGSNWRMPTNAELDGLLANCEVVWATIGGVNGRKFTGKEEPYKSNSIFLPAAGDCYYSEIHGKGSVRDQGSGLYWSSTPNDSDYANFLYFLSGEQDVTRTNRFLGCSVRAVLKE